MFYFFDRNNYVKINRKMILVQIRKAIWYCFYRKILFYKPFLGISVNRNVQMKRDIKLREVNVKKTFGWRKKRKSVFIIIRKFCVGHYISPLCIILIWELQQYLGNEMDEMTLTTSWNEIRLRACSKNINWRTDVEGRKMYCSVILRRNWI